MAERAVTLASLLERAAAANRGGDLAHAEWLCSAILTAWPDHYDALHLRGVVAHRRGRNEEALDHIDRALALGLASAEAYGNRGTVLCALSRFPAALARFDRALSVGPATAEMHCNRGSALYELGHFDEALISYDKALSLRADFAPTHVGLASVLCALGRYREAVHHEAEGLALRADWNSRMDRLITEERHDEATALLEEAMPTALRHRASFARPHPVARIDVPIRRVVIDCGHHLMHQADAADLSEACGLPVQLIDLSSAAPADYEPAADTLVIYSHGIRMATVSPLRAIKEAAPSCPLVTWNFANHMAYLANALLAATADIAFPAHATPVDYLARWARGPLGPVMPLALFQWSRPTLARLYRECRDEKRTDALSGHFSLYAAASRRNRLLADAIEEWPETDLSLRRGWSYHARSPLDRFLGWRRRKVSVALPVCGDLSMRFFDALAAGQVPIVPRDILDFDRVVPPADQASLPIIRLDSYDVGALRTAHAQAIAAFDRGGEAAAEARHRYVLRRHMLAHRIGDIVAYVTAARKAG
jgi:tetratricopeptide (TPR) repeat protein